MNFVIFVLCIRRITFAVMLGVTFRSSGEIVDGIIFHLCEVIGIFSSLVDCATILYQLSV